MGQKVRKYLTRSNLIELLYTTGVSLSVGPVVIDHAAGTRGAWSSVHPDNTGCWRLGREEGLARRWLRWVVGGKVCIEHIGPVGKQYMPTVPRCVRVCISVVPLRLTKTGDLG